MIIETSAAATARLASGGPGSGPGPFDWWDPYYGLPGWAQGLLWFLLGLTLVTYVAVAILVVNALREPRWQRRASAEASARGEPDPDEAHFLWVFVVPALNEAVTIADSVGRLLEVKATHKVILVVDDGSDDATPTVLAGLDAPGLVVLRREPPRARHGKAAALDDAWDFLRDDLLARPEHRHWSRDRVIVCIIDADGRLDAHAPQVVAASFERPRVAGVQTLVRIYNRGTYLTWAQDVEFGISARLYQLGRSFWGTANMGGNGQFNRLAALDAVATGEAMPTGTERGPWRDRLTEDQDIGVRLLQAGWRGEQTIDTFVAQQGVTNLRRLVRQRVRWAQGSWQSVRLLRGVRRMRAPLISRLDGAVYLLMPILELAMGLGLVLAVVFWLFFNVSFYSLWLPALVFFLGLSFFPAFASLVLANERSGRGLVRACVGLVPYTVYSWLIYPAIGISFVRELLGVQGWAKTAREPLDAHLPDATDVQPDPAPQPKRPA